MDVITYTRTVYYQAAHQVRAMELWEVGDTFVQATTWMEWDARDTARPGTKGGHTAKRTEMVVTGVTPDEGRAVVDTMIVARERAGYVGDGGRPGEGLSSMGRAWNLIDAMRTFIPDGWGGLTLEAEAWLEGHEYYKDQAGADNA